MSIRKQPRSANTFEQKLIRAIKKGENTVSIIGYRELNAAKKEELTIQFFKDGNGQALIN